MGKIPIRDGNRVLDISNDAAFPSQKAEDFLFVGLNPADLNDRFSVLCDDHRLAAFGDLVHHGEALEFELGARNLLHQVLLLISRYDDDYFRKS